MQEGTPTDVVTFPSTLSQQGVLVQGTMQVETPTDVVTFPSTRSHQGVPIQESSSRTSKHTDEASELPLDVGEDMEATCVTDEQTAPEYSNYSGTTEGHKKNNQAEKPYDLPPCKICGSKGTGFHYGVNTCEACKGFFRRSLLREDNYTCKNNQHCQLRPNHRRMCPHCRLQKCIAVGMSKDGIKTGRYSAEKKLTDMHAVKQLKAQKVLTDLSLDEDRRQADISRLVETLVEARHRNFKDWDVYDNELAQMQQQFMIRWRLEGHAIEGMTIADMFERLGSDEQVEMFNRILSGIEDAVRREIKFAKSVPGFRELTMEDQVALCKVALSDIRVLDRYKWFDQESRRVTTDRSSAILDIVPIFGEEFADVAFRVAKRLCDMELTDGECSVLVALAMFGTDRCELSAPDRVQAIQDRLVEALQWLLRRNHPDDSLIFPRLVAVLTELRPLHDFAKATVHDVLRAKMDSRILQVPPVFWEMLSPT